MRRAPASSIEALVELSRYAAQHPRFVQGSGGNCSVKFSGNMAIKASGFLLRDVSRARGYVVLPAGGHASRRGEGPRPSLEAGLHRILHRYVIHTHPVSVAALVCAKEGPRAFRELFPQPRYQWVSYSPPGASLIRKIKRASFFRALRSEDPQALFLANHGLAVSGKDRRQCVRFHEEIVRKLERFFGPALARRDFRLPPGRYLTPDHLVFWYALRRAPRGSLRPVTEELKAFLQGALSGMKSKGWTPAWLSRAQAGFLLAMEGERYRQSAWKRSG